MPHTPQSARLPALPAPMAERRARRRWLQHVLALPRELQPIVLLLHIRRKVPHLAAAPPPAAAALPPATAAPPPAGAALVERLTVSPVAPGADPLHITIERR